MEILGTRVKAIVQTGIKVTVPNLECCLRGKKMEEVRSCARMLKKM